MSSPDVVRYQQGSPIDTSKVLEVLNLPAHLWGPIEATYPEIAAAGPRASFHGKRNVTIRPPHYVSARLLRTISTFQDPGRSVYLLRVKGELQAVLIHVHGRGSGYDEVHIYRAQPHVRRWWRRR